ncbi:MAG TPA: tetratricopeptide repeat protein [Fervidobacterium sp.]|nr:tetratricopeptide repeat protein [Fervidobacterium sp.]HQQ18149.1 tetratricopeptide repeat protein [Fervidobacterium sp.]HRD21164.1 tetratricopeptide repeat protein [Fervidobacterium sp.]
MKMNLTGSVKIMVILLVVISSTVVLPITVQEIRDKSKEDPDFAWDMYLAYLSSSKNPDQLQDLGRLIYAKRKLKDYDFVLKEDVNGLLDFLAVHEFTTTGKYYLFDVFDKEFLIKYLSDNLETNTAAVYLFKLFPERMSDYLDQLFPKLLQDNEIRTFIFSNVVGRYPETDGFATEFFDKLFQTYEKATSVTQRKAYLDVYAAIKSIDSQKYSDIRFEKELTSLARSADATLLSSNKVDNKDDGASVTGSATKSISDTSTTADATVTQSAGTQNANGAKISPSSSSSTFLKFNAIKIRPVYLILIALAILIVLLLIIPSIRYRLYLLLGLKSKAAGVYKKIVDKDPFDEEKRLRLAQLYEEAGMYEEAMNEYNFLKRIKLE